VLQIQPFDQVEEELYPFSRTINSFNNLKDKLITVFSEINLKHLKKPSYSRVMKFKTPFIAVYTQWLID
jgi:hypothetical protein